MSLKTRLNPSTDSGSLRNQLKFYLCLCSKPRKSTEQRNQEIKDLRDETSRKDLQVKRKLEGKKVLEPTLAADGLTQDLRGL